MFCGTLCYVACLGSREAGQRAAQHRADRTITGEPWPGDGMVTAHQYIRRRMACNLGYESETVPCSGVSHYIQFTAICPQICLEMCLEINLEINLGVDNTS